MTICAAFEVLQCADTCCGRLLKHARSFLFEVLQCGGVGSIRSTVPVAAFHGNAAFEVLQCGGVGND